jgi:hypothetical protein
MKAIVAVLALTVALAAPPLPGSAARVPAGATRTESIRLAEFRLHVEGRVPQDATFWVAYGPLGGHFGLMRLRAVGRSDFEVRERLPATGSTIFAYISGHGAVRTRLGWVPGGPVTTIRRIGPVALAHLSLPTVQWRPPLG